MTLENLETKVAVHGEKLDDHERRIRQQEDISQQLRENNALLREQMKDSKEKDVKFSEVMDKIYINLSNLNSRFDHVEQRVGLLEDVRNGNLIDITKLWKTTIFKVVPGLILAWLIYQFGIK